MPVDVPRVYLHDGAGRRIGQFSTAYNVDRAYLIMEPASARFMITTDDPLADEIDPRQGRYVVIDSDAYPYPWVGKLTQPNWTRASETITIICRSADAILTQRFINGTYSGAAGAVFTQLVNDAAALNATGIGVASTGVAPGDAYAATFNDRPAFQCLTTLAREVGYEWWVE